MDLEKEELEIDDTSVNQPQNTSKMSMREAMGKYSSSDELDVLNFESEVNAGGSLFERVVVPSET